jgi:hypothetical protein
MKPYLSCDGRFHRAPRQRWMKIADATPLGIAVNLSDDWEADPELSADPAWAGLRLGGEMTLYLNWSSVATAPVAGNPAPMPLLRLPDGDALKN